MDILSHAFSGLAVATVVASFSKGGFKQKAGIMLLGTFAGALPDFDAISLWSKFDGSIGKVLNLKHNGNVIYFSKFWYSHHGALHSLTFAALIPLLFLFVSSLSKPKSLGVVFLNKLRRNKILVLTFFLGFSIHLLEDMPTPACVWGGVNFLWPSSTYYGGFGNIWWWNNYDLFIIIMLVIILNIIAHTFNLIKTIPLKKVTISIFSIGLVLFIYQMNTRGFDFNYTGHTPLFHEYELKSKLIQQEILGEYLYQIMLNFDNSISLNF
ncbi:MAG: inner membrane protein [Glaciecola sp.]|jgi:inner membrane protein